MDKKRVWASFVELKLILKNLYIIILSISLQDNHNLSLEHWQLKYRYYSDMNIYMHLKLSTTWQFATSRIDVMITSSGDNNLCYLENIRNSPKAV